MLRKKRDLLWTHYKHSLFALATDFDLKVLALKYKKKIITSQFITFKQNSKKKTIFKYFSAENHIYSGWNVGLFSQSDTVGSGAPTPTWLSSPVALAYPRLAPMQWQGVSACRQHRRADSADV